MLRSTPTNRGGQRKLGPVRPLARADLVSIRAAAAKSTDVADATVVGVVVDEAERWAPGMFPIVHDRCDTVA